MLEMLSSYELSGGIQCTLQQLDQQFDYGTYAKAITLRFNGQTMSMSICKTTRLSNSIPVCDRDIPCGFEST